MSLALFLFIGLAGYCVVKVTAKRSMPGKHTKASSCSCVDEKINCPLIHIRENFYSQKLPIAQFSPNSCQIYRITFAISLADISKGGSSLLPTASGCQCYNILSSYKSIFIFDIIINIGLSRIQIEKENYFFSTSSFRHYIALYCCTVFNL